ncbi:MAG: Bug family tripartite tricarboxylate transporter substrate binding protein [Lautropia sp.]
MKRRTFMGRLGTGLAVGFPGAAAWAETYPSRPVRIILGFAPGGSSDQFARLLAQHLTTRLKQAFVVENRPGAATTMATTYLLNAPPDGYTLSVVSSHFAATPKLYPSLPYDVNDDFAPVGLQVIIPALVVVSPQLGVATLQELVAKARKSPGSLSYGSTGTGGVVHLSTERFKLAADIDVVHVPYKNDFEALIGVMRGDIAFQFGAPSTCLPHIRAGKLVPLAWSSPQRNPALPDVPTIAESGYPGFSSSAWFGLIAPKKTPGPIIERLSKEIREIMALPDVVSSIRSQGMEVVLDSTPESFTAFIRSEAQKWAEVIVATGVKAN